MTTAKTEEQKYTTIKKYDEFEIRYYPEAVMASVTMDAKTYREVSGSGFRKLAGFIFGGNQASKQISMTSPVSLSMEDSMTMMFMVPKNLKKENLPEPNQSQIEFRQEPAKKLAAIRFGGWTSAEKLELYKKKLIAALDAEGIKYYDRFSYLGYNAPFDLFFRRNEVVVEVE